MYFLVNNTDDDIQAEITLRNAHGRAVLWNIENGRRTDLVSAEDESGSRIKLDMAAGGAVFVEFDTTREALVVAPQEPVFIGSIAGKWRFMVDPAHQTENPTGYDLGVPDRIYGGIETELMDWTALGMPNFSGCAEYQKEIPLNRDVSNLIIDLGEVRYMASVSFDGGAPIKRFWPPFRFSVGSVAAGIHTLHVRVGNLMVNQLQNHVTDSGTRKFHQWAPKSEHFKSGMFGPVVMYEGGQ